MPARATKEALDYFDDHLEELAHTWRERDAVKKLDRPFRNSAVRLFI